MSSLTCPRCRRTVRSVSPACPGCGTDLSALRRLSDLADRHYNDGLRAARAGRWAEASEHLAVTLALSPDDLEATVAAARVARRQGRADRVAVLADHAARLAPRQADVDGLGRPLPFGQRWRTLLPERERLRDGLPTRDEIDTLVGAVRAVVRRSRRRFRPVGGGRG